MELSQSRKGRRSTPRRCIRLSSPLQLTAPHRRPVGHEIDGTPDNSVIHSLSPFSSLAHVRIGRESGSHTLDARRGEAKPFAISGTPASSHSSRMTTSGRFCKCALFRRNHETATRPSFGDSRAIPRRADIPTITPTTKHSAVTVITLLGNSFPPRCA